MPSSSTTAAEGVRPLDGVDELPDAADLGDALVAERGEVAHGLDHRRCLVVPGGGERTVDDRAADHDGGQADRPERGDPRVVHAQVDHQHAVDAVLAPPAPVDGDLVLDALDELDRQRDGPGGQLGLDAGDELHEERLQRERLRRTREEQPARVGARSGERARGAVRVPAELVGDREDAVPGVVRDARPAVERVRDGALGDPGEPGDVADRRPPCHLRALGHAFLDAA